MITADVVRLGTQALTAVLLLGHVAHVWELATLQAVAGAAGGFFAPASTALVPQTISGPRLQQANALLSLSQSATNIFGPALSGVIVAVAGPGTVFAIDSASFLVSAGFLAALAGPLVGRLGVWGTLILAAALMSVPNLCVVAFVREVRQVRRREAPDPAPA